MLLKAKKNSILWIQDMHSKRPKGCLQHHGLCQRVIIMQLQESLDEIRSFWSPHFLSWISAAGFFSGYFTPPAWISNESHNQDFTHGFWAVLPMRLCMPSVTSWGLLVWNHCDLPHFPWVVFWFSWWCDYYHILTWPNQRTSDLLNSQGRRKGFYNENSQDFERSSVPWTHVAWLGFFFSTLPKVGEF